MKFQEHVLGHARRSPGQLIAAIADVGIGRLRGAVRAVLYDWQAERARAELRKLSDRTLADIGLSRAQIESLYREPSRHASQS